MAGSRHASVCSNNAGTTAALSACFNGDTAFSDTTGTATASSAYLDGDTVKFKLRTNVLLS